MARKGKFGKKPSRAEDNKKATFSTERAPSDKIFEGGSVKRGAGHVKPNYAGLIFMCSGSTKMDCYKYRVFGLPEGKKNLVEQVRKGMRLFLFDVDLRLLYGIYTASSHGAFKLERDAFGGAFPWQVRFTIQKDCLPLSEDIFKAAIKENYMDKRKFKVELTAEQVQKLVKLFRPLPGGTVGSPLRPRKAVSDGFDMLPKTNALRYEGNNRHIQDRNTQGYLPHGAKFEPNYVSDDLYIADRHTQGNLPPRAKYEPIYAADDRHMADRHTQGNLPPRAKYEPIYAADDRHMADRHTQGNLPPRAKYEPIYAADDRHMADRHTQGNLPPRAKYEPIYAADDRHMADRRTQVYLPPRANHESIYAPDELYLAREARLQRETPLPSQTSVRSLVPGYNPLTLYGADPVRPLSELPKTDPYQIRARDELYSGFPQGHTLGNSAVELDSVYRQRLQMPEVRGDLLDRRLLGLDSLVVDNSLTYAGGVTSEILGGRPLDDIYVGGHSVFPKNDYNSSLLRDGTAAVSGSSYRGEVLPQSRHYVGGGW